MASTKRICGTVIKKLKLKKKTMKRSLGIIAFIIGLRVLTINIRFVLLQLVYMCKRISIDVCSETPFRNQSANLLRKSIDRFLYDTSPHRKVFPNRL